ncbi:MAG: hypothetical protein KatS3mg105_3998 [Gemmatales bacterium]|nr:MAG: hypothetical protein KatS3mg105_3998 [Gemmatales bacterium]
MSFRSTYILFALLFVQLIVFGLTQFFHLKKPKEESQFVFAALNETAAPLATDFDSVVIERDKPKKEQIIFVRYEQGWKMTSPHHVLVDNDIVDRLIGQVTRAKRQKADISQHPSEYELDPPGQRIRLHRAGKEDEIVLNIGRASSTTEDAVVYVTTSETDKVLAVKKKDIDLAFQPLQEFLAVNPLSISALNTSFAELKSNDQGFAVKKTAENNWQFTRPASYGDADYEGGPRSKDDAITGVKFLLEAIGRIHPRNRDDYIKLSATDDELENYGLTREKPATLFVKVTRTSDRLVGGNETPVDLLLLVGKKVELGKKPADKKAEDKKEKADTQQEELYYARFLLEKEDAQRPVVRVPGKEVERLLKLVADPAQLRNRNLVSFVQAQVDAINIKNKGTTIKLRKTGELRRWYVFDAVSKPVKAKQAVVDDLIRDMVVPRLIREFPTGPDAEYGLDKSEVALEVWTDGIDRKAEEDARAKAGNNIFLPKLVNDEPNYRFLFGKTREDAVYVKKIERGKKPITVVIADTLYYAITANPLSFVDPELLSFVDKDAVRLEIERGGIRYTIARDDKDKSKWKFETPKELAGKAADSLAVFQVLRQLSQLKESKVVAEKADDLSSYGLDKPAVKAVVTIDKAGKTEQRTYLFGNDIQGGVYAKQGERDWVFLVLPQDIESVRKAPLRDRTVFRFELRDVKEVKFSGWNVAGQPKVLHVVRKDDDAWEVKEPPDFKLDAEQLNAFVGLRGDMKAEKFISKLSPRSRFKLEAGEAFQMEILLKGSKEPLRLTVGALCSKEDDPELAGKSYYAQSNTLPGDVFLVPSLSFEKMLKAGPRFFAVADDIQPPKTPSKK